MSTANSWMTQMTANPTDTIASDDAGSVVLGALAGAAATLLLIVAIAVAAMSLTTPSQPTTELLQDTTPIYVDTTPLSGPSMH